MDEEYDEEGITVTDESSKNITFGLFMIALSIAWHGCAVMQTGTNIKKGAEDIADSTRSVSIRVHDLAENVRYAR